MAALVAPHLCGSGGGTDAVAQGGNASALSDIAKLGQSIFGDQSKAASGQTACATCDNPDLFHAPANELCAQFGGPVLDLQGARQSPSIRYLATAPVFSLAPDGSPTAGLFWDGRAATLKEQASGPLLDPVEMANANKGAVIARVGAASYASEFKRVFGAAHLERSGERIRSVESIEASSGGPRNPPLRHNDDPAFFDLGLCARPAGDLAGRADLCGAFQVPSWRNVAMRQVLFHNGRFADLKQALQFDVRRETNPEKWYSSDQNGAVFKYDDLPPQYRVNVNTAELPYKRKPGDAPALSDAEIDHVVAFLDALTDGYQVPGMGSLSWRN